MPTLFERIIQGEIPARFVYEDDQCVAFHDVHPQAPVHVLLIPRRAILSLDSLVAQDTALVGHLLTVVPRLAQTLALADGYRVVINCGRDGGQSVDHLHLHILGGRSLAWPPG